ncbi:MAG: protein kinase [Candidatus Acidiferrum sp.]|jgi:serine/threonine protein kinase/tetratricopeptide (TPR) repeat protein
MADPKSSQPPEKNFTPQSASAGDETLLGDDSTASKTTTVGVSAFSKGQVLAARFRILRFVARGGMGEVYEAEDLELNERVALKTVRFEMADNERSIERFKREIQLARKVTHPNVCRTFDVFRHAEQDAEGSSRETLIVSMELLRGTTLSQRIQLDSRLSTARALPIVEQIAAGLQAAHDAGVVHRDFKSANVILVPVENHPAAVRAVITDFGLAHTAVGEMASLTGSLEVVGTPAYMAPEQLEGKEITPATDTYALGIVMYEMLTGALPFAGGFFTTAMRRLNEPAPSPRQLVRDIDPLWETVILRCLERAPQRRFASASDVATALHGEDVAPAPPKPLNFAKHKSWIAAVALALSLVAVVSYVSSRRQLSKSVAPGNISVQPALGKARTSVAILGFQDLSAKPGSDVPGEVLVDSLWSQLDADAIRFIPPGRVDDMRRDLGITSVTENPGKDDLSRIAKYLGNDVLLTGSYRAAGDKPADPVEWNIHLVRTSDGESLGSVHQPGTQATINDMASRAGKLIRSKLGINLTPQEEARLDSSLSANPDAAARFAEAREKLRAFDFKDAIKLLQSSVDADPKFVKARVALAGAWSDLGFEAKAQEEAKKALDLSSTMSAESKGLVTGRYFETLHDWPKAMEQYSSLWTLYPDEPEYGLLLARSQTSGGKAAQALTTLEQVRKLKLGEQLEAQVDLAESDAQESVSNFDKQMQAATAAANKAQSLSAGLLLARARIQQCAALLNGGKTADAKMTCDEAQKLNQNTGDTLGTARATNEVANAYWKSGDFAKAEPLYQQALGLAQTIGDKRDEAGALNNLANIRDSQGDESGAIHNYQQSIAVARERGSMSDEALAQQMLGMILYLQGRRKEGETAFQQAIQIARRIGDRQTEARALNNRCSALLNASEIPEARKSCEESLRLRRGMDDQAAIANSLAGTADVELIEGELSEAGQNYSEALRIQEQLGQKADAAITRIWLAALAIETGRFDDGRRFAEDAAKELALEKDLQNEGNARSVLAELLLASGDIDAARSEAEHVRRLAEGSADHILNSRAALVEAKIDVQTGDAPGAIGRIQEIIRDARKSGDLEFTLQAELALGRAQLKAGHNAEGQKTLTNVARESRAKGFGLLAKKASTASH